MVDAVPVEFEDLQLRRFYAGLGIPNFEKSFVVQNRANTHFPQSSSLNQH